MSLSAVVILVVLFLVAAYAVVLYNGLVRLKHGVGKAWANIDVLLRQRHEELPKLVETCKQYMQHERSTLEQVISARNAVSDAASRAISAPWGRRKQGCAPAWAGCSPLPRTTPSCAPTTAFATCSSASAGWRAASPTAASCTTSPSI